MQAYEPKKLKMQTVGECTICVNTLSTENIRGSTPPWDPVFVCIIQQPGFVNWAAALAPPKNSGLPAAYMLN